MKFALKSLAVAAALAAAGAASAQTTATGLAGGPAIQVSDPNGSSRTAEFKLLSGGGNLNFSSGAYATTGDPLKVGGALGALNTGKVAITGVGGVNVTETFVEDELGDQVRVGSVAAAPIASITAVVTGPNTGNVAVVNSSGGARQVGPRISGTLTGGTADVTNLRFDIANGLVIADLSGTKLAIGSKPAVAYGSVDTVLWTFNPLTDVTGPTRLDPNDLLSADPVAALQSRGYTVATAGINSSGFQTYDVTANNVISNLQITTAGRDFFVNSLGLLSVGVDALNGVNGSAGGWGTVISTLTFNVGEVGAVPEPSTYALMGLGLVGISLVARRRRAS